MKNPSRRFISNEVEVARIRGKAHPINAWVERWSAGVVEDGSLPEGGFEINTSPANGDQYIKQITELADALADANASARDPRCGMHVHTDARDLTWWDMRKLILLYEKVEPAIYAMLPESRRTNSYCVPVGSALADAVRSGRGPKEMKVAILRRLYGSSESSTRKLRGWRRDRHNHRQKLERGQKHADNRYSALNLHSWIYRGTIEWRFPPGTTQRDKMLGWGLLCASLVDTAERMTEAQVVKLAGPSTELLQLCCLEHPRLRKFIQDRIERYGPGVEE